MLLLLLLLEDVLLTHHALVIALVVIAQLLPVFACPVDLFAAWRYLSVGHDTAAICETETV